MPDSQATRPRRAGRSVNRQPTPPPSCPPLVSRRRRGIQPSNMSNIAVGQVYQAIINEVIEQSRTDFDDVGLDDVVLEELRQVNSTWPPVSGAPAPPISPRPLPAIPTVPLPLFPVSAFVRESSSRKMFYRGTAGAVVMAMAMIFPLCFSDCRRRAGRSRRCLCPQKGGGENGGRWRVGDPGLLGLFNLPPRPAGKLLHHPQGRPDWSTRRGHVRPNIIAGSSSRCCCLGGEKPFVLDRRADTMAPRGGRRSCRSSTSPPSPGTPRPTGRLLSATAAATLPALRRHPRPA